MKGNNKIRKQFRLKLCNIMFVTKFNHESLSKGKGFTYPNSRRGSVCVRGEEGSRGRV